jgi:hypothetical protein
MEHAPRDLRHVGEDIPRAGSVLSTLKTSSELAVRVEDVEVVGSDEGLRETDDGALQRGIAVVVGGVLGDIAGELTDLRVRKGERKGESVTSRVRRREGRAHLDLSLELPLEAREEDLALTRLEAVNNGRNRTNVIRHREEDELLVDEVAYGNLADVVIHEGTGLSEEEARISVRLRRREEEERKRTTKPRSHSLRSSAFFLLNAMSIRARSSAVEILKGRR